MIYDTSLYEVTDVDSQYDVVIVGGGPAGIITAKRMSELGRSVAVIEGGGLDWEQQSQDCYRGKVVGDEYFSLEDSRLRYFGGSGNHWGGMCRPLEAHDFDRSDLNPLLTWPITKTELSKYEDEVSKILEIEPNYFSSTLVDGVNKINFQFSPPVNFASKFLSIFEHKEKIDLYLNSNITDIHYTDQYVHSLECKNYNMKAFKIKCQALILATGGIENSRLLLHFQTKDDNSLLDRKLPIGQYWMEHPHFSLGEAITNLPIENTMYLALTEEVQRKLGVLNAGFRIEKIGGAAATNRKIKELLCTAPKIGEWLAANVLRKNLNCTTLIRSAWEQEPSPTNNIVLTAERDKFGLQRVILNWKKNELDYKTIRKSFIFLATQFNKYNLGVMKLNDYITSNIPFPDDDELAGYHHMGGTRMSTSPKYGVVDADLRVHGTKNLYVIGSSVFPTGGHANPTFTILQLAHRLADKIRI
jgi:hypothetical protein